MADININKSMVFKSLEDAKAYQNRMEFEAKKTAQAKEAAPDLLDDVYTKVSTEPKAEYVDKTSNFKARTKQGDVEEVTYSLKDGSTLTRSTITDDATGKLKSIEVKETRKKDGITIEDKYSMGVVNGSLIGHLGGLLGSLACALGGGILSATESLSKTPPHHTEMVYKHEITKNSASDDIWGVRLGSGETEKVTVGKDPGRALYKTDYQSEIPVEIDAEKEKERELGWIIQR